MQDVRELIRQKTAGAIIGRSLYEGQIQLEEVLELCRSS
jgi:phosphoribosylformimino-5-aminoimidazole carboxamide ribonucleotide (ProFAR) isomerase